MILLRVGPTTQSVFRHSRPISIEPQNEFQFLTNILSTLEIAMGKTVKASFTSEQFEEKRLFSRYWNAINSFDADALPEDSLATVKELVAYTEIFFPVHFSFTSNRVDVSLYEDGKSILYRTQEAYDDTLVDDFFGQPRPQETVEEP